ncbi:hypothetical protein OV203_10920 [Nannocystis sp. ILAH1]|uniref:hypothetical protein n=1 Tax=Nannocystis sp. ILAH1 TaxID=2996789 RepID=UPI00226DB008|nr:hypothetical protein [Nannocystis sp. ILAH1]MCY0987639.1 hypothetical protein [Nannocystis sp. ILAH1]
MLPVDERPVLSADVLSVLPPGGPPVLPVSVGLVASPCPSVVEAVLVGALVPVWVDPVDPVALVVDPAGAHETNTSPSKHVFLYISNPFSSA